MNIITLETEWKLSYCVPFQGNFKNYTTTIHIDRIQSEREQYMKLSQCLKSALVFILKRFVKHRIAVYSRMAMPDKTNFCINVQSLLVHAQESDLYFVWGVLGSTDWSYIAPAKANKWTEVMERVLDFYKSNPDLDKRIKRKIEGGQNG